MLSPYEQRVLDQIEAQKQRELAKSPRTPVPARVKSAANGLGDRARRLPGAGQAAQAAANGYGKAAAGTGKFMARSAQFTLSGDRVLKAYRRRGQVVEDLVDIQAIDLQVVDRVARFARLNHLYAGGAMVEGAGAAFVIGGGQLLAAGGGVAGAGAGAAPGLGVVAAAVAGDAAAVLVAASRVVAHTGLYYGYDPEDPKEEIFLMSVIGLGAATTQGAKMASYGELARLTQLLARNAPWASLNRTALASVSNKFAAQFGAKMTKKKLGQFVPVAGIVIGGGLNYAMIDRISDAAYWSYRERFLREKLGEAITIPTAPTLRSDDEPGAIEDSIDLLAILEEEGIDTRGDVEA